MVFLGGHDSPGSCTGDQVIVAPSSASVVVLVRAMAPLVPGWWPAGMAENSAASGSLRSPVATSALQGSCPRLGLGKLQCPCLLCGPETPELLFPCQAQDVYKVFPGPLGTRRIC